MFLADAGSEYFQPGVVESVGRVITLLATDENLDGNQDILTISWNTGSTTMFGNGRGGFSAIEPFHTFAVGVNRQQKVDINGDGFDDLAISSAQANHKTVSVHFHDGVDALPDPETYKTIPRPHRHLIEGLGAGDLTGNGLIDIVLAENSSSPARLWILAQRLRSDVDAPTFVEPVTIETYRAAQTLRVVDVDGNGYDDIIVVHGAQRVGVYLQDQSGMSPESLYPIPYGTLYGAHALAVGDISSDGCVDVAIANRNSGLITLPGVCEMPLFTSGFEVSR
ncbi:MAG: hypothetical protein DHS20C11_21400 [Lysobacteraceae bacterium]|nr:MAG: hypothetical protein DHS20C11_21400 [Xanthomonadaceae bacterium]